MPNGKAYTKEPASYNEHLFQVNMKLDNIETDVGEIRSELLKFIDESRKCRDEDNKRFGELERGSVERKTKLDSLEKTIGTQEDRIKTIDGKTNVWGSINTVVALIAGLLGITVK